MEKKNTENLDIEKKSRKFKFAKLTRLALDMHDVLESRCTVGYLPMGKVLKGLSSFA